MSHKGKAISTLYMVVKHFLFGSGCNYVEEIIKTLKLIMNSD